MKRGNIMKKSKLIGLSITILIIMTMFISNASIVNAASFKDVEGYEFYAEAAENLSMRGILSGYSDGEFKPEKTITRAEMAKLVCVMQGDIVIKNIEVMKQYDYELPFEDVSPNHWARPYIRFASDCGVINGYVDGTFKPEKTVLYEEAVKMIVCALGFDREVVHYEDDWAKGYLGLAEGFGITNDCYFERGYGANRGNVAVMIYNAVKGMESAFHYTGDPVYFAPVEEDYEEENYKEDYKENYEEEYKKDDYEETYEEDYIEEIYKEEEPKAESYEESDYGIRGKGEYLLTFEKSEAGVIEGEAGYYKPGEKIKIKARAGKYSGFMSWTSDGGGEFYNVFKSETTFTMPASDVVIKASYIADYGNNGTDDSYESDRLDKYDGQNINLNKYVRLNMKMIGCGSYRDISGPYHPGQVVELSIGEGDEGIFLGWSSNDVDLPTPNSPSCKIVIPDHDVTVTATFSE